MIFSRRERGVAAAALFILGSLFLGACGAASSPSSIEPTSTAPTSTALSMATTSVESSTVTTILFPAVDTTLGWLRLDLEPRPGIRLAVGGLREIPADGLDPRERLIEGEIIIENRSTTPFTCGPDDFRLYVGPFQTQIEGMTASTDFPVRDAVLAPASVEGHEFMSDGAVAPGDTLHGYLLTWIADRGTESYGLQYDPSDTEAQKVGGGYMNRIQP